MKLILEYDDQYFDESKQDHFLSGSRTYSEVFHSFNEVQDELKYKQHLNPKIFALIEL